MMNDEWAARYRRPEVVVVGTGRSGTSTVARILHERIGVCMGHYLKSPGSANPEGYYEDYLEHGLMLMVAQDITGIDELMRCVSQSHKDCERWGFKDPWFIHLPQQAMKMINPRVVIRTWRPLEATVKSWMRKEITAGRMVDEDKADKFSKICLQREMMMDEKLDIFDVLTIRFDKQIPDGEIEKAIRGCL